MASIVICQKPAVDYFKLTTQQPQEPTISPSYTWNSSPYTDPALFSDDSVLTSPTSPESLDFPSYTFPKTSTNPAIKSEEAFDFGTFEDWMRWDESTSAALYPTSDFFPELKSEPLSPNMNRLELGGSGIGSTNSIDPSRIIDDSTIFIEDPVSTEPLFQNPSAMASSPGIPPREGLYSTPLSWTRPSIAQMQSFNGILSPEEASKLRDIAMPPTSKASNSYPASPTSASPSSPSSPNTNNLRKRKSSNEEEEEFEEEEDERPATSNSHHPPVKKTAHNMIEKRYRTNLNDKIAALRDSVPSLRVMSKKNSKGEDIQEDLQGLTPAHKLNKATVLSKATEYIAHLEKRNKYLGRENAALKARVDAFEILVMARQPQQQQSQQQQIQQQQQQKQKQQQQQRNSMARQGSGGWSG